MKRLCSLLLALLLLTGAPACAESATTWVDPQLSPDATPYDAAHPELLEPDQLIAHSALLMEADSGEIIFEKNAYGYMYPASTTKIMTLLLGILMTDDAEKMEKVTVSEAAMDLGDPDATTMGLHAGEEIPFIDVLYGTMLRSGNEGANVIAETISGSIPAFVDLMNETAAQFGMKDTHYMNPHGLHDPMHYTTAYDLAILAREAMSNDLFRQIVGSTTYDIGRTNITRARTISTRLNILLPGSEESPNKYYYELATGIKTGFHSNAGHCFVGSASKDGVNLISVVLYTSDRGRWTDTKKLFEYGFAQYVSVSPIDLYNMNPITIEATNYSLQDANMGKVPLLCVAQDLGSNAKIVATQEQINSISRNLRRLVFTNYTRDFVAPIAAGEIMGTMTYFDNNGSEYVYNLIASRAVDKRENAPKTLSQIYAEAEADTRLVYGLTPGLLLLFAIPVPVLLLLALLIRLFLRKLRKRGSHLPRERHRHFK